MLLSRQLTTGPSRSKASRSTPGLPARCAAAFGICQHEQAPPHSRVFATLRAAADRCRVPCYPSRMPAPESSDPFEHFGEQEVSWSAVGKYRAQVFAPARQVFVDHDESIGGLILCAGAPLGNVFARLAPPAS